MRYGDFSSWLQQSPAARRPLVMGILNLTPDSFSTPHFTDPRAAADYALQLAADGADMIDIGGESTRPGAVRVSAEEQIRRVLPVIKILAERNAPLLSIDTTQARVASEALNAGVQIINDVSGGRDDPQMFPISAQSGAPIILMHMQGTPQSMQSSPSYQDVVEEVGQFLIQRRQAAIEAGIRSSQILLDPGIGFGKGLSHNLQLLRRVGDLARMTDSPLVVGPSRKSFIGRLLDQPEPAQRVFGTAASIAWCVANGAAIVRVHDVGPMAQVVKMISAISAAKNTDSSKA